MNPALAAHIGVLLLLGALLHFVPRLTRPGIFFGVTVGDTYPRSEKAQSDLRWYQACVWLATAAALTAAILFPRIAAPYVLGPLLPVGASLGTWVHVHGRTQPHAVPPQPAPAVSPAPRDAGMPGGWLLALGPLLILLAAAVILAQNWDRLPSRFPVHWGIEGQPDRWARKSFGGVFLPLIIGAGVALAVLLSSWGILRASRRVAASGEAAVHEERFRRVNCVLLTVLNYLLSMLMAVIALRPLYARGECPGWPFFTLLAAILGFAVLMIIITARMGQGGARLGGVIETLSSLGDGTPDRSWKWGIFYYNPDDPALFVEKRMGLGWTMNFGNRWSWLFLAGLLALLLLPLLLKAS